MLRSGWIQVVGLVGVCGCTAPVVSDDAGSQSAGDTSTSGAMTTSNTSPSTTAMTTFSTGPVDTGEGEVASGNPTIDPPTDIGAGESGECPFWATQGCAALGEPNAFGSVMTPLGELEVLYAYFGANTGCGGCVEPNVASIYLLTAPAENLGAGPPDGSLVLEIDHLGGFVGPFGRPQQADALVAYAQGTSASLTEDVTFVLDGVPSEQELADPHDPTAAAIIGGTLDADGDGWSVHLSFDARYCPDANLFSVCE